MANRSGKDINLYKALRKSKVKSEKKSKGTVWVLFPIVIILLLGGLSYYLYMNNNELEMEIDKINEYVNNPDTSSKYKEVTDIQNKLKELNDKNKVIVKFRENYESYPFFNSELFSKIESCVKGDIVIYNIAYNNGKLVMEVVATNIKAASTLTQDLRDTMLFDSVTYDGWSLGRDNIYTFNVTCILKSGVEE